MNKKYNNFGGITFGKPINIGESVDWDAIEDTAQNFKETVENQKNQSDNGSGFTRLQEDSASRLRRLAMAGAGIGFATGVGYAFYKQTGFWRGWGYGIVGAITLASLTRGVGFLTTKNKV